MPIIRSISGLRATLGDSLTPELAVKYVVSFADTLQGDTVVIGRDGRPSGIWIEKIIIGALNSKGKKVINLGMTPTPMVQLYTEHTDAAGGIAITASHNPEIWNGLKFINKDGVFLNKEENEEMWEILDNNSCKYEFTRTYPEFKEGINPKLHKDLIFKNPLFSEDTVIKIKARKFKICLDSVNASSSFILPEILKELDCEVIEVACNGSGQFPHEPEPIPANLSMLRDSVTENKADIGLAIDPDGDRLVLVDDNGVIIGEERTITLCTDCVFANYHLLADKYEKNIVVNLSTTRAVEDVAEKHGAKVFHSPVGEINVVSKMKAKKSVIGGEGSGGIIFPAYHYGRDSIIGTMLILKLLVDRNQTLSEVNYAIPQYDMSKTKIPLEGQIQEKIDVLENKYPNAKINKDDGIRIDFEDSWVHLRASNTEPVIRVISEKPLGSDKVIEV